MDAALTPDVLLRAYCAGIFPMSEARDAQDVFWVDPKTRGIIPLDGFRISRSLRRRISRAPWDISVNTNFNGVVRACANRPETWINDTIFDLYAALHASGYAHSIEVWEGAVLVGGVYGVTIGTAFFGESMFSTRTDASKLALAYTVDRLNEAGFTLFDTQFISDHLLSLGGIEITRRAYHKQLEQALEGSANFNSPGALPDPQLLLQRSTQIS